MGRCPPFLSHAAILPEVVVLPEPWRPAIRITEGGCDANLSLAVSLPRTSTNSSWTLLTICCAGESAVITSWPTAFSCTRSINVLTTLKLTSASSSAMRISLSASWMFSGVSVPCPRRFLNARCSFSWRFSNIDNGFIHAKKFQSVDADLSLIVTAVRLVSHSRTHENFGVNGGHAYSGRHGRSQLSCLQPSHAQAFLICPQLLLRRQRLPECLPACSYVRWKLSTGLR